MNEEQARQSTVSAREAQREVAKHQLRWCDFVLDHGEHATYPGSVVLDWLGY